MNNLAKLKSRPVNQRGVAALGVGIILLFAATIITFFAAKVGIQEQRISGNEYRSKLAFEAAQAGLDYGQIYLQQNLRNINNPALWAWTACSASRPAWKPEQNNRLAAFCRDSSGNFSADILWSPLPGANTTQPGNTSLAYRVFYFANAPGGVMPEFNSPNFRITLLAEGASDIDSKNVPRSVENGLGYSFMKTDIVTKSVLPDVPKSPLTAIGSVGGNGTGTFSIITNPNGGAPGQPLSSWSNADFSYTNGSAQTCNLHEYYSDGHPYVYGTNQSYHFGIEGKDDIILCDDCKCSSASEQMTKPKSPDGIDILDRDGNSGATSDATYFPTDCTVPNPCSADGSCPAPVGGISTDPNLLFRYFFGVCKNTELSEHIIRNQSEIKSDCSGLDSNAGLNSTGGLYWITGNCQIGSQVGSPVNPVFLIVQGNVKLSGGGKFFGLIYDLKSTGEFETGGNVDFYGALATENKFDTSGTFTLIYNSKVLRNLKSNLQVPQKVPGSWADYSN